MPILMSFRYQFCCLQVGCIDFALTILYAIFLFSFIGWLLLNRRRVDRRTGRVREPLLNHTDEVGDGYGNLKINEVVILVSKSCSSLLFYPWTLNIVVYAIEVYDIYWFKYFNICVFSNLILIYCFSYQSHHVFHV